MTSSSERPPRPGDALADAIARTGGGRTAVALRLTGVLLDHDSGTATIADALDPTSTVTVPLDRLRRYWHGGEPACR